MTESRIQVWIVRQVLRGQIMFGGCYVCFDRFGATNSRY